MAKKRIPECTRDASEADFKSDNFLLIDGADGSAKLEMELVGKQSSIDMIGSSLNAEIARATGEEAAIRAELATEKNRATGAEGTLNTALVAETTRATGAEGELRTAIENEVTRATGAEGDLGTALGNEVTRATGAEGDLNAAITAESTRAAGAESSLNTAITGEVARAKGAEGALDTAITGEITRATDAEAAMNTAIAGKQSIIGDLETIRSGASAGATALQSIVAATGPHYTAYREDGPIVTPNTDTSTKKTTLTFDYMRGPCGPKGDPGDGGLAAGFASSMGVTTTTGAAGSSASVKVTPDSGTPNTAKKFNFEFTIPKGDTGTAAGFASSMGVTTTTGAAGSSASVKVTPDSGTPNTAKKFNFEFTIPRGEKGETGPTGPDGDVTITTTTDTSKRTMSSNQRYKLSVGSKSYVFTTPNAVNSLAFDSNNQLRIETNGSVTSTTVPYAASAGSATNADVATSAKQVYNKDGNNIIAAGTNGVSLTNGTKQSVLGADTLGVGVSNQVATGTIGCGTLNATSGIALFSGSTVKANITGSNAIFDTNLQTNRNLSVGLNASVGGELHATGGLFAEGGIVYAKNGVNTDATILAHGGIWVIPDGGFTKGFGVDIQGSNNVFEIYGSTELSISKGNIVMGNGSIYLLNGGKLNGTATNAEGLNGYTIRIGSYLDSPNVLSFV